MLVLSQKQQEQPVFLQTQSTVLETSSHTRETRERNILLIEKNKDKENFQHKYNEMKNQRTGHGRKEIGKVVECVVIECTKPMIVEAMVILDMATFIILIFIKYLRY